MKLELLKISADIKNILSENNLETTKELCLKTKTELKILGLTNKEIKQLNIQLN